MKPLNDALTPYKNKSHALEPGESWSPRLKRFVLSLTQTGIKLQVSLPEKKRLPLM